MCAGSAIARAWRSKQRLGIKTVIDRHNDLKSWVVVLRRLVEDKRIRKIFAFANNHYAGHAPDTLKLFRDLWTMA